MAALRQFAFKRSRIDPVPSVLLSNDRLWRPVHAALTASRRNPAIKTFCERLIMAGKLPKVALVACMCKLLTTLNAMVRTNRPWDNSWGDEFLFPLYEQYGKRLLLMESSNPSVALTLSKKPDKYASNERQRRRSFDTSCAACWRRCARAKG